MDHVHRAGRAAQPDAFKLGAVIDPAYGRIGPGSRIVDDRIASSVEADDDHEVAVRTAREEEAVEFTWTRSDGCYEGYARANKTLGLGQRSQLGDESIQPKPRGVGRVERPVAGA